MLSNKLLRNLLIISVAIAILLPLYQSLLVHPSYNRLLIRQVEDEAVRYASYMVRELGLENKSLTSETLPSGLEERLKPASRDKSLLKLRIFSASGEIIFSSKADEIGQVNEKDYFHKIVANGRVYSKAVRKDRETAEGVLSKADIVETYVPFMVDGTFGGAFEVYYDITGSVLALNEALKHSMVTTLLMSLGFMAAILIALQRANISLRERDEAERALQEANKELERRVEERTCELSTANEQLMDEITERTLAQVALKQALDDIKIDREKLDGILRSVPDGVVVTDGSLHVLHMNAAAESILATPLAQAVGQHISTLRDDADFVRKIGQRLNVPYDTRPFDFEVGGDDGRSPRVYSVRITQLIVDESGSPGVLMLICDVTRERDVERMKNAFLGMAAHELNTPLTTIIGYTELLTAEETAGLFSKEQQDDYLRLVHAKALSLADLIDDLLDISRIESGRQLALNYSTFSLDDLVRKVVTTNRELATSHAIEMFLPEEAVQINADQIRLEQVIEHLLSNAIKYSPGGGKIEIQLSSVDGRYELVVEDEGIGMNKEQLSHIFDRFYRADSSDTAVQGVGLGMSIVRHIVLAHHGDIKVQSQPGNGTVIRVLLPLASPEEQTARSLSYGT